MNMVGVIKGIEVVPYNSEWKNEFKKIKSMIDSFIGDLIIGIEHVRSLKIKGNLPESKLLGSMIELSAPCRKHKVFYPDNLDILAVQERKFYVFILP